ncbi:MAG: DUF2845 domain-containing protein [Thermodesulfobacteriota bacterium]
MPKTIPFLLLILAGTFCIVNAAWGFRCGGRIVSKGDSKPEILHHCGEPDWKDTWQRETFERYGRNDWRKRYITVSEWLYNPGPTALIRILTFEENRLVDIRTEGYGYIPSGASRGNIRSDMISVGDSKAEVFARWGEPAEKTEFPEERTIRKSNGRILEYTVTVSIWTYPSEFGAKVLRFENGALVDID